MRNSITDEQFIKKCDFKYSLEDDEKEFALAVRNTISLIANVPSGSVFPKDVLERDIYLSHWLWGINYGLFLKSLEEQTGFKFDANFLDKVQDPEIIPNVTVEKFISEFLYQYSTCPRHLKRLKIAGTKVEFRTIFRKSVQEM